MTEDPKQDQGGPTTVTALQIAPEETALDVSRIAAIEKFQAAKMEAQQRLSDRIVKAAVTFTKASQWFDYGGKPYPSIEAAETIAARSGVSVRRISKEKVAEKDDKGVYFSWSVTVECSSPDPFDRDVRQTFEFTGLCSSREVSERDEGGVPLPNAVIEHKVLSKAHSRAVRNCILRFLGLRGLDWPDLAPIGVTREKLAQMGRTIQYKGRKGAGSAPQTQTQTQTQTQPQAQGQPQGPTATAPAAATSGVISESQGKRLWAIAASRADKVGASREEIVRDVLARFGFEKTEQIVRGQYDGVCAAAERWEPAGLPPAQQGEQAE